MSNLSFSNSRRALVFLLGCMSTSAFAAGRVDDLLAALSNAKAELEGRATRVQNCSALQSSKMLEVLRSQFDDARNPYNGRLDSWIFVLRNQPAKPVEDTLEANKLSEAFFKVNEFKQAADQALRKGVCAKKVGFLKEALMLGLPLVAPPIVEALSSMFKQASSDQNTRNELVKALEQQKIAAWRGISSYVLYDWSTEEIIPSDQINEALLRKASTSVYVNKWALEANPGPLLSTHKLPPDELPAYMLYTGKLKDLNRYTGSAARQSKEPSSER